FLDGKPTASSDKGRTDQAAMAPGPANEPDRDVPGVSGVQQLGQPAVSSAQSVRTNPSSIDPSTDGAPPSDEQAPAGSLAASDQFDSENAASLASDAHLPRDAGPAHGFDKTSSTAPGASHPS